MTTLGSLVRPAAKPFNIGSLVASLGPGMPEPPNALSVTAAITAWTNQDDDAHEPCSLVACRSPLHPGPCKGWKGLLHSVSPGTYHQVEAERVKKANARRVKRIADLKSQGKPIPRKLLDEIKPKPAPGTAAPGHNAHQATPVPLGQVNQKADLAGGQAHAAGQAVSKAAGITPNTAPLPLGPKQKKPTVAGRGPAFVITQPKVTDTYKLDKAAKITPQEWADLSGTDKKAIRDELEAIKQRGFGPQQTKADALLAKLPAQVSLGQALKSGTPGTVTTPSGQVHQKINLTPGKTTLGQAVKTPQLPAPAPAPKRGQRDQNGILNKPHVGGQVSSTSVGLPNGYRITRDSAGYSLKHNGKLIRTSSDQKSLEQYAHDHAKGNTSGHAPSMADVLKAKQQAASKTPATPDGGVKPSAPLAPGTAPHVQHAVAVANRTAPKATMGKTHVDAYGKLTKAEFDALPADKQKTIRDDLANAKGKFLDPKKQQAAQDLLDRFGSKHPAPASTATPSGAKGYSDPMNEAVKAARGGGDTDTLLKRVGALSPDSIKNLSDADKKIIGSRLDFVAAHPKAPQHQRDQAAAYSRIMEHGSPAQKSLKLDHTPSLGELHAAEQKSGHADAVKVTDALKAADTPAGLAPGKQRADLIAPLSALSKQQFDDLKPADQRKITDKLQSLHSTFVPRTSAYDLDADAEAAITKYTGDHPAIHRMKQAEADFQSGKIDADAVRNELAAARVQARGAASPDLEKEAARIAEDNPKLPLWLRASMIDNPYGSPTYGAIAQAQNKSNFDAAPRLNGSDIGTIFRATDADLAKANPIHQQAVKELRENMLVTGLRGQPGVPSGSPWSTATRNLVVDAVLDLAHTDNSVKPDRLKYFQSLPDAAKIGVLGTLKQRIDDQSNNHAKTRTWMILNELNDRKLPADTDRAVRASLEFNPSLGNLDLYRKLDPNDQGFKDLPPYVKSNIDAQLKDFQHKVETQIGQQVAFTPQDNPFKVMPAALAAHLKGTRNAYPDRDVRNAADLANYGTGIVTPNDRSVAYATMGNKGYTHLLAADETAVNRDLDKISSDATLPLATRWRAQYVKDVNLVRPSSLNADQLLSIGVTSPSIASGDPSVTSALTDLDKADYDSLAKPFREAIDERIKTLPGSDQQVLNAKFHPSMSQAATPSGVTPTTAQANIPPHVQAALDTIYGVHASGKSHTMAHQLSTYGALRGSDFAQFNPQEQSHLLADLSFIATTAKGPSADKAKKLIDRFTPPGTPAGQVPTGAVIPPANSLPGQVRYATPLKGLAKAKDSGKSGDGWVTKGGQRVWGEYGAAGLLLQHTDPSTGEKRYLMVQRGPAISDPGKWTFPGGASDSKETPHQGATRETIEELGLKDDVFKDALVHGDFTYSIPGSNWKYTSVAASVPTMIKPNLTTAHARAETSDAKWLTEAEIKQLDKDGKLHHPIAGGKLENNVISLFPQGTGVTLGQAAAARPGPVTKRPGRLTMPSGGRQAPAVVPNAWTAPHKQSTGKDLIGDKAAQDALRQKIKQERKLYDGKTADGRLAAIGAAQGFDDTPTVVDKKEIDRLLATGDYIEVFRGVSGFGGSNWRSSNSGGKTAAQINEEMRSGPAYYGKGIFGNGYYLATQHSVARQYADGTKGSIARMLIPKSALTINYDKAKKEAFKNPRTSQAKGGGYDTSTLYDPGRWAAAKGMDGIEVEHYHVSPSGGARHVAKPGQPAYNWLNRSVLIMQKEPG